MISEHEVTLAIPTDALEISELSREAIEHGLAWRWTPRRVMLSIVEPSINVVVVRQRGRLTGFAIMSYGDEKAHLQLLAVHAAHRSRGVGSALLSWLEATARVAGIGVIQLETRAQNLQARAFYISHGFIELGLREGYYQGVEDAVRMSKNLGVDPP